MQNLGDAIETSLTYVPADARQNVGNTLLVAGGHSQLRGLAERVAIEMKRNRPLVNAAPDEKPVEIRVHSYFFVIRP